MNDRILGSKPIRVSLSSEKEEKTKQAVNPCGAPLPPQNNIPNRRPNTIHDPANKNVSTINNNRKSSLLDKLKLSNTSARNYCFLLKTKYAIKST